MFLGCFGNLPDFSLSVIKPLAGMFGNDLEFSGVLLNVFAWDGLEWY